MPTKKKSAAKVTRRPPAKRMSREPVVLKSRKDGKLSSPAGPAAGPRTASPVVAAAHASHPSEQMDTFEQAIKLFHARKFREALARFAQARSGPDRAIADKADLHVRMCNRRLEERSLVLNTPDERYDYAITLINARSLNLARQHLLKALEQQPNADHIYYALALCDGLGGDLQAAYENLKRAIEIQPRNRITARQDADFASIANQPPLDRLLFPERVKGF